MYMYVCISIYISSGLTYNGRRTCFKIANEDRGPD